MAIPSFFLTVLTLSLSVVLAAGTSTFQDFCVADPQEKGTVDTNDYFTSITCNNYTLKVYTQKFCT